MTILAWICMGVSVVLVASVAIRLLWALVTSFRMGFGRRLGGLLRSRSLWVSVVAMLLLHPAGLVLQSMSHLAREGAAGTGRPAPALDGPDMNGDVVTLADLEGRYVLLYFWHTKCGPCTTELPELKELQDRYEPERLTLIGVAYDTERDAVEAYLERHQVRWRQILDGARNEGRVYARYGPPGFPYYYLIGPSGSVERTGRFVVDTLLERGLEGHQSRLDRLALWLRRHARTAG